MLPARSTYTIQHLAVRVVKPPNRRLFRWRVWPARVLWVAEELLMHVKEAYPYDDCLDGIEPNPQRHSLVSDEKRVVSASMQVFVPRLGSE